MIIVVGIIILGAIFYFASQTDKAERTERVNSVENEIVLIQEYMSDLMLAGYDMVKNPHSERDFLVFKKLAMNNHHIVNAIEHQLYLGKDRQHEAGFSAMTSTLNDIKKMKTMVSRANSYLEAFPNRRDLEQMLDVSIDKVTRQEIIDYSNQLINQTRKQAQDARRTI
ncbi:hypothetical protein [Mesobacillus jeotgali]|uniref:hypothetical protein n=1 Tax=Mesobacillus jeotgali TaxID=129985 RepID=UPI000C85EAD5|nr:hypothetical protein [Mesobacillus jeotgali]